MVELDAAPYGGARYPVDALLANRRFITFHLDVGVGDAAVSPPEWIAGHDLLGFAGIQPARIAALPVEQQFAEKIHAYTLPRTGRENTRVRDLIDLVLLIDLGLPERQKVVQAIQATFERRMTDEIQTELPDPPEAWREQYTALAAQSGVSTPTIQEAFNYVSLYWQSLQPEF